MGVLPNLRKVCFPNSDRCIIFPFHHYILESLLDCIEAVLLHFSQQSVFFKPVGLDLSRRGLDWDSQSRHFKNLVSTCRENLDTLKKLVSTSMSRPKSLNQDREIRQDLKILVFLDREVRGFLYFLVEISQSVETHNFQTQKALTMSRFLDKSRQSWLRLNKSWQSWRVSTILTKISTRQSLYWKVSILKILTEKKKKLISISIGLDCRDPQA